MVTISFLAIVSFLMLAILSLARVQTRSTTATDKHQIARANARMALMIAVGRLQKAVGPDQRITSSSAVLGDNGDQNLLGVWESIGEQIDDPWDQMSLMRLRSYLWGDKPLACRLMPH